MEQFLSTFVIFISGLVVGWILHARSMLNRLTEDPDKMIHLLEQLKKVKAEVEAEEILSTTKLTEVRVEKIGNQFYLYTTTENEFLGQGTSLEDALEAVKKRYPNRNFKGLISKEDAEKMGLSKQN